MAFQRPPAAPATEKQCYFCTSNRRVIDYKDSELLRRFMSAQMKIVPRRRSGLCATHQRAIANAIKRARTLGIVAYTLH